MGKFTLVTIGGVPLVIDVSIILLAAMWLLPDLQSGDPMRLAMAVLVLLGVLVSIVLHELGHSYAGRMFGTETDYIELNGLGGLCVYAGAMPRQRWKRIVMILAGPAMTLLAWRFCVSASNMIEAAGDNGFNTPGIDMAYSVLWQVGSINYYMLLFNLLPAFPLDGGRALKELLAIGLNPFKANWIVACLGMLVAAYCAVLGFEFGVWMYLMAALLAMENYRVLQTESRTPWRRWN